MIWLAVAAEAVVRALGRFFSEGWPGFALAGYTLGVWALSRFVAKYQEQRDIAKHLPEIVQKEVRDRDARIKALEGELAGLKASHGELVAASRFAEERARRIAEELRGARDGPSTAVAVVYPRYERKAKP
jgi:hypothetical protein